MSNRRRIWIRSFVCGWLACWAAGSSFAADDFDRAPIEYGKTAPDNPASRLFDDVQAGRKELKFDEQFGYLPALLDALKAPRSSQTLVFSKTSLQRHRITPKTPRSLYFNDEVYIGYCVDGDVLEISAVDPKLGTVFYTVEQTPTPKPKLLRQGDSCLICHASSNTQGVPGHVLRSVYADPRGLPLLASGTYRIDQTSPFHQRWGGWYVTGRHGQEKHLGNLVVASNNQRPEEIDNSAGMNLLELPSRVLRDRLLTPHSDLIALLVLEHQTEAHNHLTRASFEVRQALYQEQELNRELDYAADHRWPSTDRRVKYAAESMLKYFLSSEAAGWQGPVSGTSDFTREFPALGPRDRRGRSLRDLDLNGRLWRYPCSYLVYSPSFAALPSELHSQFLARLRQVLSGEDTSPAFSHLSPADRLAIHEILLDTLPAYAQP